MRGWGLTGLAAVVCAVVCITAYRVGVRQGKFAKRKGKKSSGAMTSNASQLQHNAQARKRKNDAKAQDRQRALGRAEQEAAAREADTTGQSDGEVPRRVLRAETVLSHRTERFVLVMECCVDRRNIGAVLRTAEALGLQHVWTVVSPREKGSEQSIKDISLGAELWLTVCSFESTEACIAYARREGYALWATDLAPGAVELSRELGATLPPRLAVVMGRELDGVSQRMLDECDQRIFIPMFGFTESLNLSVASALVMDRLFAICPTARGDLSADHATAIRREWYQKLGRNASTPAMKAQFERYLATAEQQKIAILPDLRKKLEHKGHSISKKVVHKLSSITESANPIKTNINSRT